RRRIRGATNRVARRIVGRRSVVVALSGGGIGHGRPLLDATRAADASRDARRGFPWAALVTIFWLQADSLRFTTTSKSGFITSLYVPLTPLLAIVVGERVRPGHAVAAIWRRLDS